MNRGYYLHIALQMTKIPEHRNEEHATRFLKLGKSGPASQPSFKYLRQ